MEIMFIALEIQLDPYQIQAQVGRGGNNEDVGYILHVSRRVAWASERQDDIRSIIELIFS